MMVYNRSLVLFAMLFAFGANASEPGGRTISGPVVAEVIRVIDGDTILVAARPWPQQTMEVYVRLRGIDAPELKSPCPATRKAGLEAQAALEQLVHDGEIGLTDISGDKYFGRVLANVILSNGRNPAQEMLSAGYAVSYGGGRKSGRCAVR